MPICHLRAPFCMEGDEIKWRARLFAMREELAQELARPLSGRPGAGRSAYTRARHYLFHGGGSNVIEPVVFFRCAVPVRNIRLVPDLEVPGRNRLRPIFFGNVLHPFPNQLTPFVEILRGI